MTSYRLEPSSPPRRNRVIQHLTVAMISLCTPLMVAAGPDAGSTAPASAGIEDRPLVEQVRFFTQRFKDPAVAMAENWLPATPCVSGPDTGAMGVHFINGRFLHNNGKLLIDSPAALIYEPLADGSLRFVGVEYIVLASEWAQHNSGPPALGGDLFNFVDKPNRYGLEPFYELHVWAWQDNPQGTYSDWNTRVSCIHQPGAS